MNTTSKAAQSLKSRHLLDRRTALKIGAGTGAIAAGLMSASPQAGRAAQQEPVSGGTLRYGAVRDVSVFDPHQSGGISNAWMIGNIYDKLITFDQEGAFVGELAESWEQTDDLHIRFHLRSGVTFHNGQTLTARDVAATVERVKDPATQAANADVAQNINSVDVIDDHTIELTLEQLDLGLMHALASDTFYIISEEDVDVVHDSPDNYNGTGPFTLESWEPRRSFNLEKNAEYWKPGQPYLDRVELMPILDDGARVDALLSGELDLIEYVPWQSFDIVEAAGAQLYPSNGLMSYIRLNTNMDPLTEKPLRQAISYAINREDINAIAFGGYGVPMTGPLQPPGTEFHFDELEGYYTQDLEKAAELVSEAGYESPADVPAIDFQVSTSALAQQPAQVIQQQLQDFGLTVDFRTIEVATLFENRANGTYTLHMDGGGMAWPDPDYLRTLFHSEEGTSHAVGVDYSNPELDALLEEGASTSDVEARREIYRQAEEIILDDCPMIFVLWRAQGEAAAAYVRGYYALPNGLETYRVDHFEELWFDQ